MTELEALKAERDRRRREAELEALKAELHRRRLALHLQTVYPEDWERRWATVQQTVLENEFVPDKYKTGLTLKQAELLAYDGRECLYGGSAGGGKSIGALMAASQYVHVPGYHALIVRKTYKQLAKAESILNVSKEWWFGKVKWNGDDYRWTFPSGATIEFGHLDGPNDHLNFQGSVFHFIAPDELTQFPEESQYSFLFTRQRKPVGYDVPIRMRPTSNPGGPGHCLPHGEVLTPQGWKDIREFQVGDPVYGVNADGELVPTAVEQVHASHYDGEMVEASARGLNIVCTPNHRVAKLGGTKRNLDTKFSLVPFDDLPGQAFVLRSVGWAGRHLESFTAPCCKTRKPKLDQPFTISGDHYCELMGWFLSEGHARVEKECPRFDIAQKKPHGREKIADLLNRIGFHHRVSANGFHVCSRRWAEYLVRYGKCRDKYVPEAIKNATPRQIALFFRAAMDGDGHWVTDDSGEYYTISKRLADDMAEVAVKLGYAVHCNQRQKENRRGLSYCVSFKRTKSGGSELLTGQHRYDVRTTTKRRSDIQRVPYSGMVYCIGVPEHHAFVVRQNGSVWVSGNSWVYKRFIDPKTRKDGAHFIPAKLHDNPNLNQADYIASMDQVDPITRAQMLEGDWSAVKGGRFLKEWFRYYRRDGDAVVLYDKQGGAVERFLPARAPRWMTCDPAAGTTEASDHFVLSTWCISPQANLVWLDCHRARYEIPEQLATVQRLYRRWNPQFVAVEEVLNQKALAQLLRRSGDPVMAVRSVSPLGKKKIERATPSIVFCSTGRLYLPEDNRAFPLEEVEGELVRFTGEDGNPDDICDSLFYSTFVLPQVAPYSGGMPSSIPAAVDTSQVGDGRFVTTFRGFGAKARPGGPSIPGISKPKAWW
jgi:phage terminase large subunit-like protein